MVVCGVKSINYIKAFPFDSYVELGVSTNVYQRDCCQVKERNWKSIPVNVAGIEFTHSRPEILEVREETSREKVRWRGESQLERDSNKKEYPNRVVQRLLCT